MRFLAKADSEQDESFQIAPMIDIVFILLVFFVATYAVNQQEKLLDINLPDAKAAKDQARSLNDVLVNLDARGRIYLYRRQRTPEYLEACLRRLMLFARGQDSKPGVIIRADGECEHKHVVRLMDICARAGIDRVFFSTVHPTQGDSSGAGNE